MRTRRRWRAPSRPPVEPAPRLVGLLTDFWALPPALATDFWRALRAATWSRAVNWRQQVALFEAMKEQPASDGPHPLLYAASAPAETIAVVEDLCGEGLLTRTCTTQVQEHILRAVGPTGDWGFHAGAVGPEAGLDLAAVIEEYWR